MWKGHAKKKYINIMAVLLNCYLTKTSPNMANLPSPTLKLLETPLSEPCQELTYPFLNKDTCCMINNFEFYQDLVKIILDS